MNNHLLIETNNHCATITLNRPDVHNAFDDQLIKELQNTLDDIKNNNAIRVVILKANGKHFSAGADLQWMQRMVNYTEQQNFQDSQALARLMQTLHVLPQPTIAVVQGSAFGGGVGLIACCDMAIASPAANFCFSEVKLGLIPAVISPYVIAAIGERATRRYFLTAERFTAATALQLGLISEIVSDDNLSAAADTLVKNILQNSPQAVRQAKQLIANVADHAIDAALIENTAKQIAKIRVSNEAQEGLQAFLDKRKPKW